MIDPSKLWLTSSEAYHADLSHDSHSSLELFRASREKYAAVRVHKTMWPDAPTPAMIFGNLFHCLLLEPKKLGDLYIVEPDFDRRTRDGKAQGKAFDEMAKGKILVTMEETTKASAMREGLFRNLFARRLIEDDGISEASITWECAETGCPLKARFDRIHHSGLLVDIKTTHDIGPDQWARTVWNYKYHRQRALYLDGAAQVLGIDGPFIFLAVSKDPPHECAVYTLAKSAIELGRQENMATLRELAECRRLNRWTGRWSDDVHEIDLPRYAYPRD